MAIRKGMNHLQAKKRNINLIKQVIYQYSPISRAEIAEMLSLTPATITINVSSLINLGLIREIELTDNTEDNSVGRRPIMLEFVPDSNYVIGIEISPRGVFLCLCNVVGEVISRTKIEVELSDYHQTLDKLTLSIHQIIQECKLDLNEVVGIGIGIPGFIDHKSGYINSIWEEWKNHDIESGLYNKIGIPVFIDNNAAVRAVSDGLFAKDRPGTFAYLFASRGIACPLMIQSSVLSRKVAGAGELGHMSIDINGPKCPRCGDFGCLDIYAGELGILERCVQAIDMNEGSILKDIAENPLKPTIEEVITAASKGDVAINGILDNAVKYLALGICNIIKFISPEMVVVDAYILELDGLKQRFLEYIDIHLMENRWGEIKFVFKPFDAFGGAIGAAGNAIKNFVLDN